MSLISSYSAASGLKNANLVERAQCSTEKMKNNLKYNMTNTLVTGATVAAGAAVVKSEKLQNAIGGGITKIADKISKTETGSKLAESATKIFEKLKANPNLAKSLGLIAAAGIAVTGIISHLQTHENGKIEGKFQAKANMDENFSAQA